MRFVEPAARSKEEAQERSRAGKLWGERLGAVGGAEKEKEASHWLCVWSKMRCLSFLATTRLISHPVKDHLKEAWF